MAPEAIIVELWHAFHEADWVGIGWSVVEVGKCGMGPLTLTLLLTLTLNLALKPDPNPSPFGTVKLSDQWDVTRIHHPWPHLAGVNDAVLDQEYAISVCKQFMQINVLVLVPNHSKDVQSDD